MIDKLGSWFWVCANHLKQLGALFFSISAFATALWSMFAVDASILDAKVTAVSVNNQVLVELITYVIPPVSATVYYRINGEEILHHHYEALPDGKHIQVLALPIEHPREVRVDVEIVLEGIRTWFKDNDVKFTEYVVTGG